MSTRNLPARPDIEHLRREARTLQRAFAEGDADARERVGEVLGTRASLKLTEAQRVLAREYGFRSWSMLRAHVQAARGIAEATDSFLAAVLHGNRDGALDVLEAEPKLPSRSLHVAAVLGAVDEARRLIAEDPSRVGSRAGAYAGEPLLWLCYSPFHGESSERDAGLTALARALLDAGADPNTRDGRHGIPALYALTGVNNVPPIARMLLEAGAEPNDGESLFHAAERFHEESLELLREFGADPNATGDWGNTPLYFLLRYWDLERQPTVEKGLHWLLNEGADPNVLCDRTERENSLHVAVRRGQPARIVRLLLEHGADVHARRGDGRTPWSLARRGGFDALTLLLEEHGAEPEPLSAADLLLEACSRGDVEEAARRTAPDLIEELRPSEARLLVDAAAAGRIEMVRACLAAGFDVGVTDESGATALHHAAIHGHARIAQELLTGGADPSVRDRDHASTPLGWACFGADHVRDGDGDYAATVRALIHGGASVQTDEHSALDQAIRRILDAHHPDAS